MRILSSARSPLAALALLLVASCSDGDGQSAGASSVEDVVARERAVALFELGKKEDARKALAPIADRADAGAQDLVLAAALALQIPDLEDARGYLDRARQASPEDPAVRYLGSRIAQYDGDLERCVSDLRGVLELHQGDLAAKLGLASVLLDLDVETDAEAEANADEAKKLCLEILDVGVENGTGWYVSAAYRMFTLAIDDGDTAAQRKYDDLYRSLQQRGFIGVSDSQLNQGLLAKIAAPRPTGSVVAEAPATPAFTAEQAILPELAGASGLIADDLDGDRWLDLIAWGEYGLFVTRRSGETLSATRVVEGPIDAVLPIELHNANDTVDLLYARGPQLVVLEQNDAGDFAPSPVTIDALPSAVLDFVTVDYDHDGDLDLLLVGAFGVRLLRNDGAGVIIQEGVELPRGGFTDATTDSGLPSSGDFAWCTTEDFDADLDVDLLLGGADTLVLASNLRGGRFADRTSAVFPNASMPREPLLADFDGDARVDAFVPGAPSTLWTQRADGSMERRESDWTVPAGTHPIGIDLDLDGALDVAWAGEERTLDGVLALGQEVETALAVEGPAGGPVALGDIDFVRGKKNDIEIVQLTADGVRVARPTSGVGGGARFKFVGVKDNRAAIGAIVEVRARELYRRIYWRGQAEVIGVGDKPFLDVVRVTWPNGVVQSTVDVELGDQFFIDKDTGFGQQTKGQVGSCPFLYTWNGTTYEFISDVLGITPLGLPMAPGQLVPPDHDEYVLVRGDQLVPKDGFLELQITEELREVTYLDRVRLDVVDHPAGTEIYPDERFCFPPFPPPHTHTVQGAVAPRSALASDGRDWAPELTTIDDVHAVPFEAHRGQYQGLVAPHWIELAFDPDRIAQAKKLRLVCTGWLFWTDASVNVATARTPGIDFVPPIVQVPDGQGGWSDAGPPVGFPAGKTKSMVIDVTGLLRADEPRLRLFSTLELYWDSIRLATGDDDAELRVTSLEPASARLWARGFSQPIETGRTDLPERFDWEELAAEPRWDQHPGQYTRYGETLPLLEAIDDQFVIFGAGDTVTVRFDARELPPPAEGFVRDYLVFFDGWAKDRDPNTVEALNVEPLPFHGMSGYPYGEDERYPESAEHARYRAEWNTRAGYRHIVPMSPVREDEWVRGQ
ncbi:MAG: hypothetical protein GY711_32725 [bacterium]|nr:hypothetical protein [bacterium]